MLSHLYRGVKCATKIRRKALCHHSDNIKMDLLRVSNMTGSEVYGYCGRGSVVFMNSGCVGGVTQAGSF
jgi:hypothetical protein